MFERNMGKFDICFWADHGSASHHEDPAARVGFS